MKCTAACSFRMFPLALAVTVAATGTAAHADAFGDAIAKGKSALELRYRLENVDQAGIAKEANASTLRTRVRYTTGEWMESSAMFEFDNVSRIGDDRYNDTRNGKTMYPLVVDPDGAELNQALVKYMGIANTPLTIGRQRVNLDNQRFIGSVGWRQNEQTLDGALLEYKGVDRLTATLGYITRVNRINGPDAGTPAPEYDSKSSLLNVKYVTSEKFTGVGYAYLLSFDNAAASSNQTLGLRATGKIPVGSGALGYSGEFARQSDYGRNPVSYSADYLLAELTWGMAPAGGTAWELQAGYEALGSDNGIAAVQTPLATLHKFQGWADKLLTTPNNGVIDTYLGGTVTVQGYGFTLVGHQYDADNGSASYGTETNAQVAKTFAKRYTLTLKYADYSADTLATDTKKLWLMGEAKF